MSGLGSGGVDDNDAQAGRLIVDGAYQCHGGNVGPMGALRKGNGGLGGGVPFIATPEPLAFHTTQDPISGGGVTGLG